MNVRVLKVAAGCVDAIDATTQTFIVVSVDVPIPMAYKDIVHEVAYQSLSDWVAREGNTYLVDKVARSDGALNLGNMTIGEGEIFFHFLGHDDPSQDIQYGLLKNVRAAYQAANRMVVAVERLCAKRDRKIVELERKLNDLTMRMELYEAQNGNGHKKSQVEAAHVKEGKG